MTGVSVCSVTPICASQCLRAKPYFTRGPLCAGSIHDHAGSHSLGHFTVVTLLGNFLPIKHGVLHRVDQINSRIMHA